MSFGRSPAAGGEGLILAIEDTRLRFAMAEALRRAHYDVHEAANGSELKNVLALKRDPHGSPPVAVVMDLRRPGHGAIEGARLLREHGQNIALIVLSSHPTSTALALADERVTAILQKPVDLNELQAVLATVRR